MNEISSAQRRCVIIPSYNSGKLLKQTVSEVLALCKEVIVVIDGSTDESSDTLASLTVLEPTLHLLTLPQNQGKGAAVLKGMEFAATLNFTHAIVFDADGQHAAYDIPRFMDASHAHPEAMILGVPLFATNAPSLRVKGRLVGNWWTNLETLWGGVQDSLYGFRLYPIDASLSILKNIRGGRRFDFDTQLAVRLYWSGVPPLNLLTRVEYKERSAGGVSHFHYLRDNLLLVSVHTQLTLQAVLFLPHLLRLRKRPELHFP